MHTTAGPPSIVYCYMALIKNRNVKKGQILKKKLNVTYIC